MAYIWGMSARFRSRADAEAFQARFDSGSLNVPSAKIKLLTGVHDREDGEAEYDAVPYRFYHDRWYLPTEDGDDFEEYLNGHGGPANDAEVADLTKAGNALYERLRDAPPTFLYALCGVETSDWLSLAELTERADDIARRPEAYHGLVLSEPTWVAVGSPSCFVQFGPTTKWIPWRGPGKE